MYSPSRLGTKLCLVVRRAADVTSSSLTVIFLLQRPIVAVSPVIYLEMIPLVLEVPLAKAQGAAEEKILLVTGLDNCAEAGGMSHVKNAPASEVQTGQMRGPIGGNQANKQMR